MPDPDRPSNAPLSESEADRLSERFTASWDQPGTWSEPEPPALEPATVPLPMPAAAPGPVASVPATTPPLTLVKAKQTLLGIAPIVVGPSPPPLAPPASGSALATPPASSPAAAPAAAPNAAVKPPAAAPAPTPSSPEASAITQGLTTPSKPYVPKEDASTPAVVISEALGAVSPGKPDRARIAHTIPAQTRSGPLASATPLAVPSSPASSPLDDTYPPARRKSSKIPLVVGGVAMLAAVAVAAIKLSGGNEKPADRTASETLSAAVAPAPPVPPPPPTEPAKATAEPVAAETPPSSEPTAQATPMPPAPAPSEPKPAATKKSARPTKKTLASPAPRKLTTKPEPRPALEPAPAPAPVPKPAKGVIVRETPF